MGEDLGLDRHLKRLQEKVRDECLYGDPSEKVRELSTDVSASELMGVLDPEFDPDVNYNGKRITVKISFFDADDRNSPMEIELSMIRKLDDADWKDIRKGRSIKLSDGRKVNTVVSIEERDNDSGKLSSFRIRPFVTGDPSDMPELDKLRKFSSYPASRWLELIKETIVPDMAKAAFANFYLNWELFGPEEETGSQEVKVPSMLCDIARNSCSLYEKRRRYILGLWDSRAVGMCLC